MGVDIVNHELFLVCGAITWAFNLRKKRDENGQEIPLNDMEYSNLLISKPAKFSFDLTSRNEAKRERIVAMWEAAEREDGIQNEPINV